MKQILFHVFISHNVDSVPSMAWHDMTRHDMTRLRAAMIFVIFVVCCVATAAAPVRSFVWEIGYQINDGEINDDAFVPMLSFIQIQLHVRAETATDIIYPYYCDLWVWCVSPQIHAPIAVTVWSDEIKENERMKIFVFRCCHGRVRWHSCP